MKLKFIKLPPKKISYRDFSTFNSEKYTNEVESKIAQDETDLAKLNRALEDIMNKHAPLKTKIVRGNNQAHMTKELRKEIMTRSRNGDSFLILAEHIFWCDRYLSVEKRNNSNEFWSYCKPFFSNKSTIWEENISLFENENLIKDDKEIAHILNEYFKNITKYLPLTDWNTLYDDETTDDKFASHPSIKIIKSNFPTQKGFSFEKVNEKSTLKIINQLDEKKSVSGKISTKLLKLAKNQADITPIFKKGDPKTKSNYRPISLLPLLSKIFEKIIQFQLSSYFELKLSKKLCAFREKHSTQHTIFQLIRNLQDWLDDANMLEWY